MVLAGADGMGWENSFPTNPTTGGRERSWALPPVRMWKLPRDSNGSGDPARSEPI
jgi:hypothetical protein